MLSAPAHQPKGFDPISTLLFKIVGDHLHRPDHPEDAMLLFIPAVKDRSKLMSPTLL